MATKDTTANSGNSDSVIEQSAQTVGEIIESGATVVGRGLAAGVEGMAQLAERAAQMTGLTSPRAIGKAAENATRTTMTAARSAATDHQRAARSTANGGKPDGGPCDARSEARGRTHRSALRSEPKRTPKRAVEARRAESVERRRGGGKCLNRNQCSPSGEARRAVEAGSAQVTSTPDRVWCTGCTVTGMESVHGKGGVKCGPRDLGRIQYEVEVGSGGHASLVKFEHQPNAEDGDRPCT